MTPLYFGLCVRKGRRRGLLSVAVVQQTVIVFVGSWTARLPDQVVSEPDPTAQSGTSLLVH